MLFCGRVSSSIWAVDLFQFSTLVVHYFGLFLLIRTTQHEPDHFYVYVKTLMLIDS